MKSFFLQHRTIIPLVVILLLVSLALSARNGLLPLPNWAQHIVPQKVITVTALPVNIISKPEQMIRTGSIESPKSAPVHAELPGRIVEVYVKEGQPVKTDQPLVKMLRSTESSINNEQKSTVPTTQNAAATPEVQTSYDNALKEYNRFKTLYEHGAVSKRQFETAEIRLQAAKESLTNGQPAVQDTAQFSGNNSMTISNNAITISAPNAGTVVGLSAAIGKIVESGQPLMTLDVGEVQVVVHLQQNDLYLVHSGTPATIEASGQTITGQVASIYPEVGVNNLPAFRAHINIANTTNGLLKTGMSVNVHISTGKSALVRTVPISAVFQDEQGLHYIYLVDNGKALRQQVNIGGKIADSMEITSDLPEKALIITTNVSNIKNGDFVTVI